MEAIKNYECTVIKEERLTVDGNEFTYKLTARISNVTVSFKLPLYSIEVTMKKPNGNTTSAVCSDAFADLGRALIFFDKIVRCIATPIDLAYVYEDDMQ